MQAELILSLGSPVVRVSGNCVFTGKPYSADYPAEGYKRWREGELIQNAMPTVSADDREWLISGVSPEGWAQTFGEDS